MSTPNFINQKPFLLMEVYRIGYFVLTKKTYDHFIWFLFARNLPQSK